MSESAARVSATPFGLTPEGDGVQLFTFINRHGLELRVMNYGGIIVSLKTPDRNGQLDDIVLGHDTAADYFTGTSFFGAPKISAIDSITTHGSSSQIAVDRSPLASSALDG